MELYTCANVCYVGQVTLIGEDICIPAVDVYVTLLQPSPAPADSWPPHLRIPLSDTLSIHCNENLFVNSGSVTNKIRYPRKPIFSKTKRCKRWGNDH